MRGQNKATKIPGKNWNIRRQQREDGREVTARGISSFCLSILILSKNIDTELVVLIYWYWYWALSLDIEYCGTPSSCGAVIVEAGKVKPKQHITKDCRRGMSTFGQSSDKNWNNYNYDSGVLFYWLVSCLGFILLINRLPTAGLGPMFSRQLKTKYLIFSKIFSKILTLQLTPTVPHVSWPLWRQEWRLDMKF